MKPTAQKQTKQKFQLRADGSILTPEFRVSFPYIFEQDKNGKYGLTMIFPKNTVDISELEALVDNARDEEWPKPRKGELVMPIHDEEDSDREEYQGSYYVNGKCGKYRPGVINIDKTDITDPEEFYPGCWARAVITIYTWDYKAGGKYGVSVNVRSLMKVRDDEPLVGRVSAEHDFDGIDQALMDV